MLGMRTCPKGVSEVRLTADCCSILSHPTDSNCDQSLRPVKLKTKDFFSFPVHVNHIRSPMARPLSQVVTQPPTRKGFGLLCGAAFTGECHNPGNRGYRVKRRLPVTGYPRAKLSDGCVS